MTTKQEADEFDAIFDDASPIEEKPRVLRKYVKPKKSSTFKCYKSLQESKIFAKGENIVTYSVLYRFATIHFAAGKAPSRSKSGHFVDINLGNNYEFGDPWVDGFEVKITDKALEKKVNGIIKKQNWEAKLEELGFLESVQFDILDDETSGSTYKIDI